jgi:cytidine deaminase
LEKKLKQVCRVSGVGMKLDQRLVDAAIAFVNTRFPGVAWAGAAAMYSEDGDIFISTAPAVVNESVSLCHETGAICEAYSKSKKVTASVCVSKDDHGKFVILSPCGVCQERLWYWGGAVEVAVPQGNSISEWQAATLCELAPHYWRKPFMK